MSLPDLSETLWDFGDSMRFRVVKSTIVDHVLKDDEIVTVVFDAVVQPIPPAKLMVKTEGERTWRWWTLWTLQALDLDSMVKDENDFVYRVVNKTDWNRSGYFEYELTEGVIN